MAELSRPALAAVAERIVGQARAGEQVEAYVGWARDTAVRVYDREVESLSSAESEGVGIRVVLGDRQGFAYAGSLDEAMLADTLNEARDNAGFATPDEAVGLATPDGVAPPVLDLWRDDLEALPAADKVALALELEERARAADSRIRQVESANYGDAMTEVAIASSTGVRASHRRTGCHLSAWVIAGQGDDTQTGGGYSVGRSAADLSVDEAATDAVERATRMLGSRKARSARLPVVFDRRVTSTVLAVLAGTFSGEAVLKGRSLFAERLGEEVAGAAIVLVDDPTNPDAFGASVYDAEGLACRRNVLIDAGVVSRFVYDSYSARRAGTTSTGSAVRAGFKSGPGVGCRAVSLQPGTRSTDEILSGVGHGLFVQTISGVHSGVNPVSGDFSVGAEGMMIRDGKLAEPVREITIASTLQRMLREVIEIGGDLEWLPGVAAGLTLAVDGISLSGE
ncbi:MAG TPA: TldD/PmbA family protein [Acidimicrobiales bacterium]|nr:TldD/PmbA family protein [Acidimicrobiales bacterium]